jgi:hypothetical protein
MRRLLKCGVFFSIALSTMVGLQAQDPDVVSIVSEVKVFTWNAKKGAWAEGQVIKIIAQSFDKSGRQTGEDLADAKRALLERAAYVYGKQGVTVSYFGPDKGLRRTVTYERSGELETETAVLPDGRLLYVNQNTYDGRGLLKEVRQGGPDGSLVYLKTYEYDSKGNLASVKVCNPDGSRAFVIEYAYRKFDERGVWIARAEYYTYGDVRRRPHEIVYRKLARRNETR